MTRRAVVTGGGGFVGRFLIQRLLNEGYSVASVARSDYPILRSWGAETHQLDLARDDAQLEPLFHRADVVFHVAAKVDMWGKYDDFFRANVLATKKVIAACQAQQVPALVYTSSPSVVAGGEDLCGVDESYPYPEKYLAYYPATKALAEREVLAANGQAGLRTLALRPHLIWGPHDVNLIPTVLERARAGKLVRIGAGDNLSDFTYIDDCVDAHLCAARALNERPESAGKAYFISQGSPVKLWWWVDQILAKAGLPPLTRSVPRPLAESLAWIFESAARLTGSDKEPLLTRFLVKEMATSHYFNISRARELLGFQPQQTTVQRLDTFQLI
jgi:nucleoside-diphosphate-sugar epimerase